LGNKTFEQVQNDLNKMLELEKRPTPEQLKEAAEAEKANVIKEREQEVRTIEEEKNKIEKLLKETQEQLTNENTQQQQRIIDLQKELEDALASKKPELSSPKANTENKAKKGIQKELDKFSKIEIEEMNDKEFSDLLNKFKIMKNWARNGNEEESEASRDKQSELKEKTDKLGLESYRRR